MDPCPLPPTPHPSVNTAQGGVASPGFSSQLGHAPADGCELVTSPSNTPLLQGLCKMGMRLLTLLFWPGLGCD